MTPPGLGPSLGVAGQAAVRRSAGQIDRMPRRHRGGLRRCNFELPSWNLVQSRDGSLSNASVEIRPLGGEFQSGDQFEFNLQQNWDVPPVAFEIFPGSAIDAGRYQWNRAEFQFKSSGARPLGADVTASVGDFYYGPGEEMQRALQ